MAEISSYTLSFTTYFIYILNITDLISAVVELLGRDISRLVMEAREALEPVEL
jgi:hypothetical protein